MAGRGQRFIDFGYKNPKPLIEVVGVPMIKRVIHNLDKCFGINHDYIFIIQKDHNKEHHLETYLKQVKPFSVVIETEGVTEGAACTALLAEEYIDNQAQLLIANSDQLIAMNPFNFNTIIDTPEVIGCLLTFESTDPKFSYAECKPYRNKVVRVVEKEVISNIATCGIYYFKYGHYFVSAARDMIKYNKRHKNEFYIAPCYNELIKTYDISRQSEIIVPYQVEKMVCLGTPDDLERAISNLSYLI